MPQKRIADYAYGPRDVETAYWSKISWIHKEALGIPENVSKGGERRQICKHNKSLKGQHCYHIIVVKVVQ